MSVDLLLDEKRCKKNQHKMAAMSAKHINKKPSLMAQNYTRYMTAMATSAN